MILTGDVWAELIELGVLTGEETCALCFEPPRVLVDVARALRVLAQRTGVELAQRTPADQEHDDNLSQLRQLLEEAVIYYHHLLKNAPGPGPQAARDHLDKRGLTSTAVEMFQLGYAPEAWDAALKYFTGKNYAQQD